MLINATKFLPVNLAQKQFSNFKVFCNDAISVRTGKDEKTNDASIHAYIVQYGIARSKVRESAFHVGEYDQWLHAHHQQFQQYKPLNCIHDERSEPLEDSARHLPLVHHIN